MNIKVKVCDKCRFVTRDYYINKCGNCGGSLEIKTATVQESYQRMSSSISGNIFLKHCNSTYMNKEEITHIDGFLLTSPILLNQWTSSSSCAIDPGV